MVRQKMHRTVHLPPKMIRICLRCSLPHQLPCCDCQISASDCQISGIPAMQMQGMLEKAERLLCDPGSIIPEPSNTPNSFCVRSESNKKSHFVYQLQSSGKTICKDCPQWFSSSICAHSVAVAEKCGNLKKNY